MFYTPTALTPPQPLLNHPIIIIYCITIRPNIGSQFLKFPLHLLQLRPNLGLQRFHPKRQFLKFIILIASPYMIFIILLNTGSSLTNLQQHIRFYFVYLPIQFLHLVSQPFLHMLHTHLSLLQQLSHVLYFQRMRMILRCQLLTPTTILN